MKRVILYGKPGCCLCDDLAEHVRPHVESRNDVTFEKRDITTNDAWQDLYRFRIPVLVVDGQERLDGRVEKEQVDALFAFL